MEDRRIKAGIKMTSKDGGGDIKATADFSLSEAVYILCQVVSKASPLAIVICE
jgi:hypothetical protein